MLPVVAGMAALGLVKGLMDKKKEDADRRQAAEMMRWSPWSGMKPNEIRQSDVLGSTMQGGMTGAMMGSMMGGGGAAAGGAGGAMATSDPAAAQSLTGGQSMMQGGMQQKYPWLGMNAG